MTLDELRIYGLLYLATPYSKYPQGLEVAFRHAAALSARLLLRGVKVYSPIVSTHPIAIHGGIDPFDHSIWLPLDALMMQRCNALLVAHMETWEISYGIGEEIRFFAAANKPAYHLDPKLMELV